MGSASSRVEHSPAYGGACNDHAVPNNCSSNPETARRAKRAALPLQDLPGVAVELIAQYASTSTTPGVCAMSLVCRGWQAAADQVQVDITCRLLTDEETRQMKVADNPTLGLPLLERIQALQAQAEALQARASSSAGAAAAPAPAPAAVAPKPPPRPTPRGASLAAWLAKHKGRVRSLRIPRPKYLAQTSTCAPGWQLDLIGITQALTAAQQGAPSGAALRYLVQLELPVLGVPGSGAFLVALAGCRSLRQLALQPFQFGCRMPEPFSVDQIGRAVSSLTQLRVLQLTASHVSAAGQGPEWVTLLRQLPPGLEQMDFVEWLAPDSIPVSCVTHLVNLKAWHTPLVPLVIDDISSSSSSGGAGATAGAKGLTALTSLHLGRLHSDDARLQLPNIRALRLAGAQEGAWQQLQRMRHLHQVTLSPSGDAPGEDLAAVVGLTQVQKLDLDMPVYSNMRLSDIQPVAAAIGCLTRLTALRLPAVMLLAGGAALLAPLTLLEVLTVSCKMSPEKEFYPEGAQGWAATPAGAAVQVVAAAAARGGGRLQRLVLEVPTIVASMFLTADAWMAAQREVQEVGPAARAALPSMVVEVKEG